MYVFRWTTFKTISKCAGWFLQAWQPEGYYFCTIENFQLAKLLKKKSDYFEER